VEELFALVAVLWAAWVDTESFTHFSRPLSLADIFPFSFTFFSASIASFCYLFCIYLDLQLRLDQALAAQVAVGLVSEHAIFLYLFKARVLSPSSLGAWWEEGIGPATT
jgi:hypothetical protein